MGSLCVRPTIPLFLEPSIDIKFSRSRRFTIDLEEFGPTLPERTLFLVARYLTGENGLDEFWDNNDDDPYRIRFRRAEPEPTAASEKLRLQARTFADAKISNSLPLYVNPHQGMNALDATTLLAMQHLRLPHQTGADLFWKLRTMSYVKCDKLRVNISLINILRNYGGMFV